MLNGSAVSFRGRGGESLRAEPGGGLPGWTCLTLQWPPQTLNELPQLLLQKLDPDVAWASLLSAHKYGPRERVHLTGVLAGTCGVTMAD